MFGPMFGFLVVLLWLHSGTMLKSSTSGDTLPQCLLLAGRLSLSYCPRGLLQAFQYAFAYYEVILFFPISCWVFLLWKNWNLIMLFFCINWWIITNFIKLQFSIWCVSLIFHVLKSILHFLCIEKHQVGVTPTWSGIYSFSYTIEFDLRLFGGIFASVSTYWICSFISPSILISGYDYIEWIWCFLLFLFLWRIWECLFLICFEHLNNFLP